MNRLPNLGSLRTIANTYEDDEIVSDNEEEVSRKKMKVSVEEETKDEGSDLDIVVSDEEDDSSGTGSVKNMVAVTQPRVPSLTASRLVSYGGDEDEEEDASKAKTNIPQEGLSKEQNLKPSEQTSKDNEELREPQTPSEHSQVNSPSDEVKEISTVQEKETADQEAIPKELRDHLAAVKAIQVRLPGEPEGRCSNSLQEKIEKLLETKLRTGRDLKDTIQRKKNFRNPSIYEKLVSFCSINETGTNYPPDIYNPFSWTEDSFYENLSKVQKEHYEKKQKERSKVEFISATKKSVSAADDASKKRKSKWDVSSSGTAAAMTSLTIPAAALQSIASVQAVAAANARVITTSTTVQVKKP